MRSMANDSCRFSKKSNDGLEKFANVAVESKNAVAVKHLFVCITDLSFLVPSIPDLSTLLFGGDRYFLSHLYTLPLSWLSPLRHNSFRLISLQASLKWHLTVTLIETEKIEGVLRLYSNVWSVLLCELAVFHYNSQLQVALHRRRVCRASAVRRIHSMSCFRSLSCGKGPWLTRHTFWAIK